MDITPVIPKGLQSITGYGEGGFKINGEWVSGSLIVFPDHVIAWDADIASLASSFNSPLEGESQSRAEALAKADDAVGGIELLIIGTGKTMQPLAPDIRAALKAKGIAVDVMDTGAACRTYNVLLGEERKVAAALIAL